MRIAYGTDSGVYPGWNARQLLHGPPRDDPDGRRPVGHRGRRRAARLADRVGALARGRLADVIAVPGDPLDDLELLTDIPLVMQGGRVLKGRRAPLSAQKEGHTPA